ncbi:MAG: hypothetical protein IH984_00620 [Planctomycetes bacterium]|nr:hypothetical protein [Planctomycetota bacterium]
MHNYSSSVLHNAFVVLLIGKNNSDYHIIDRQNEYVKWMRSRLLVRQFEVVAMNCQMLDAVELRTKYCSSAAVIV